MAGIWDPNGQLSADQLNEHLADRARRNRGINSSRFWDSFRCMEELLAAQEGRNEEVQQQQQQREQREEQRDQRRAEQIAAAKLLLEELITFIAADNGRWRFKAREGRDGAKITKAHLESPFIATGLRVPESRMELLLPLAQALMKWNAEHLRFESQVLWNEELRAWGFFAAAPPP